MNILLLLAIVYVISRTFSPNRSNSILVTFTLLTDQVPKIVKWGILGLLGIYPYQKMKNNSWFNPSSNQFLNRTSKIRNLETPTRPSTPTSTKCPYLSRGSLGPIILRWRIAVYNAMKGDGLQSIS